MSPHIRKSRSFVSEAVHLADTWQRQPSARKKKYGKKNKLKYEIGNRLQRWKEWMIAGGASNSVWG